MIYLCWVYERDPIFNFFFISNFSQVAIVTKPTAKALFCIIALNYVEVLQQKNTFGRSSTERKYIIRSYYINGDIKKYKNIIYFMVPFTTSPQFVGASTIGTMKPSLVGAFLF